MDAHALARAVVDGEEDEGRPLFPGCGDGGVRPRTPCPNPAAFRPGSDTVSPKPRPIALRTKGPSGFVGIVFEMPESLIARKDKPHD